jgi:hypothetical protein
MLPFSCSYDESLPAPVLIFTIHSEFDLEHADPILRNIATCFDAMGGPFYTITVFEDVTIEFEGFRQLVPQFEDGGVLRHPNLRGLVLVQPRGFVQSLAQFVQDKTPYAHPITEAPTLESAKAIISGWLAAG